MRVILHEELKTKNPNPTKQTENSQKQTNKWTIYFSGFTNSIFSYCWNTAVASASFSLCTEARTFQVTDLVIISWWIPCQSRPVYNYPYSYKHNLGYGWETSCNISWPTTWSNVSCRNISHIISFLCLTGHTWKVEHVITNGRTTLYYLSIKSDPFVSFFHIFSFLSLTQ